MTGCFTIETLFNIRLLLVLLDSPAAVSRTSTLKFQKRVNTTCWRCKSKHSSSRSVRQAVAAKAHVIGLSSEEAEIPDQSMSDLHLNMSRSSSGNRAAGHEQNKSWRSLNWIFSCLELSSSSQMTKDAMPELKVGLPPQPLVETLIWSFCSISFFLIPFDLLLWVVNIHSNHVTVTDRMWAEFATILMFLIWLRNCFTVSNLWCMQVNSNDPAKHFLMCEWGAA